MMEHIDVIEADFMREYGIDLTEVFFTTLSFRRFMALLNALSPEAIFRLIQQENNDAPVTQRKEAPHLTPEQVVARMKGMMG